MTSYSSSQFGQTVLEDFTRRRKGSLEKGLAASGSSILESRALGHPMFDSLDVGQRRTAQLATVFLDLTNFTGRTFWDEPDEVTDLAHAILTGFVEVVSVFGGYPLGLRGDGLFAGFGPGLAATDCSLALGACAFALNAVDTEVNPRLKNKNIEPVQARAGVDYGHATFVRTGSADRNEVNVIGFASNFAAKCEKTALSWEVVVGEGAAASLGSTPLLIEHSESPKRYQRDYRSQSYKFYDYRWRRILPHLPGVIHQVNGRPASVVSVG